MFCFKAETSFFAYSLLTCTKSNPSIIDSVKNIQNFPHTFHNHKTAFARAFPDVLNFYFGRNRYKLMLIHPHRTLSAPPQHERLS